jgi:peroxiredoxin
MRRIFLFILIAIIASCKPGTKKELRISGVIRNSNSKMVFLQETSLSSGQKIIVDSSMIKPDGSYSLKTKSGEESLFHLLTRQGSESFTFAFVINDASSVTLNADFNKFPDYEVEGSPATKEAKDFLIEANRRWSALNGLSKELDSARANNRDSIANSILLKGNQLAGELKDFTRNFVSHAKSPISAFLALSTYIQLFTQDEYNAMIDTIAKNFPGNREVASIKKMKDQQIASSGLEEPAAVWTGKQAPDLSLPDANGKIVKLSSFRGKYVLVDFWASWCSPCRRENPNVVQAFNKFRNKNFTVLGVSLDSSKSDWLKAVQKDKLAWSHVSDLKEWRSEAVSVFGIGSIPFNVLVDPEGKVIAEGLTGEALEAKLGQILK